MALIYFRILGVYWFCLFPPDSVLLHSSGIFLGFFCFVLPFVFVCLVLVFEMGFLCVALAVLELTL